MKIGKTKIVPKYQPGDLLLKIREDDYWFDHIIILSVDYSIDDVVYQLFTSEGYIDRRTAEWVHKQYRKENEDTKDYPEMDKETI